MLPPFNPWPHINCLKRTRVFMIRRACCLSCNTGAFLVKLAGYHCLIPSNWSDWQADAKKKHTGLLPSPKGSSTASFSREETDTHTSHVHC